MDTDRYDIARGTTPNDSGADICGAKIDAYNPCVPHVAFSFLLKTVLFGINGLAQNPMLRI